MSKNTSADGIPTPFGADGSPPGDDWEEVCDAETGELLAYGRRIDGREAERLGDAMQGMAGGGSPGPDRPVAPMRPLRPSARARLGDALQSAALLFSGKPMPAGHFHFALPLPASDPDGLAGDAEEAPRAERARARHEQKEQRHRDKMRDRTAKVIRNARSARKSQRKAETKRKRIRGSKRSLNRRR